MGLSIGRDGDIVRIGIDGTDDIDVLEDDHQLYFLYDYTDSYEHTEPETVDLIVNLILSRMISSRTKLVIITHNNSGTQIGSYIYPCSFKRFKYDYDMQDVFYYEYFVGYVDLPDVSTNDLRSIGDMIIRYCASVSIVYEDRLNQVVPIVDMLSGKGSDFYDKVLFDRKASFFESYLTDTGLTLSDLQRNFNNLGIINKG